MKPEHSADLVVRAPEVIEFRVPAELARDRELVGMAELDSRHGHDGSAQVQILASRPATLDVSANDPILVRGSSARDRIEGPVSRFNNLFPPALCYARIVPVDQVVTLTLFHREDDHLRRLMLDDRQAAHLDRLWDELFYVAREPLKYQIAFEQIREFATQDRPDLVKIWAPHVGSVNDRADAFRQRLVATEPAHLEAVVEFAGRAWRRPLTDSERQGLRGLYRQLRDSEIPHEGATRLVIARVLGAIDQTPWIDRVIVAADAATRPAFENARRDLGHRPLQRHAGRRGTIEDARSIRIVVEIAATALPALTDNACVIRNDDGSFQIVTRG